MYEFLKPPQVEEVKKQLTAIGKIAREALAEELTKTDDELARKVLLVRSAITPLGGLLHTFPLHQSSGAVLEPCSHVPVRRRPY